MQKSMPRPAPGRKISPLITVTAGYIGVKAGETLSLGKRTLTFVPHTHGPLAGQHGLLHDARKYPLLQRRFRAALRFRRAAGYRMRPARSLYPGAQNIMQTSYSRTACRRPRRWPRALDFPSKPSAPATASSGQNISPTSSPCTNRGRPTNTTTRRSSCSTLCGIRRRRWAHAIENGFLACGLKPPPVQPALLPQLGHQSPTP